MREIIRAEDSFCDTECKSIRGYKDGVELEEGEIFGIDLNSFSVYIPYVKYDSKGNLFYGFTSEVLEKSKIEGSIPLLMQYDDKNRAKEITTGRIFYIGRTPEDSLRTFGMYDEKGNFNSNITTDSYSVFYGVIEKDPLCIILKDNTFPKAYIETNDYFKKYYRENFDYLAFQNMLFEADEEAKAHYKAATQIMADEAHGIASVDEVILKYTNSKK